MNVNVDVAPGIMASAGNTIKSNLGMMDLEYSLFTSMYAMGRMIGSLLFVSLVNAVNRKFLIVVAIFLKAITIYIFKYTNDGYFLLGVRLISGIGYVSLRLLTRLGLPCYLRSHLGRSARNAKVEIFYDVCLQYLRESRKV